MSMNSRTQKIHDSIMANETLSADEKAVELVSKLSVNPHYGKGEARYEFMKKFRSHVRNASDLARYDVPMGTELSEYINDETLIPVAVVKAARTKGAPIAKTLPISDADFAALLAE